MIAEQRTWKRVSKAETCAVCKRPDWCTRTADGRLACCMRVESDRQAKNGGWIHRLADPLPPVPVRRAAPEPHADMGELAAKYRGMVGPIGLRKFAESLGVNAGSLRRLHVGQDEEHAWTFPMRDASGKIVGIRRRLASGRKLSVKGGHEGLFYDPAGIGERDQVLLPEGPTDTAALLTLGFVAVGRPSCLGGRELVKVFVGRRDCVVVSDFDDPGLRGAKLLAGELKQRGRTVKVIVPVRGKDVREWVGLGATRLVVESVIKDASVVA